MRKGTLETCWGVFSLTEDISFSHVGYFFLSQSAQSSRSFLAHISSPQKAFGIQRTQSVSAIVDTNKEQHKAFVLLIGVSRWSRPSLLGRGRGRGQLGTGEEPPFLCVLSLFAERLLFICENLWEIKHPIDFLCSWKYLTKTHKKSLTDIEWYN